MDEAVEQVLQLLKQEAFYWRSQQATKEELRVQEECPKEDEAREAVERALVASGVKQKIKAFAFHRFRAQMQQGVTTSPAVEWARRQWAEMLLLQLRNLSKEQRQPFLRRRPKALSTKTQEEVSTRHIVELKSLFHLITRDLKTRQARDARHASVPGPTFGGLEELRHRFSELAPSMSHTGTDKAKQLGEQLVATGYPGELQIFCRFGVPASLRREVWAKCLGTDDCTKALQEASKHICDFEWLTDDVLRLDVAEHCANDVSYFPFDELVEALVLALSRDPHVAELCESGPPQIPIVTDEGGSALAIQSESSTGQCMPPSSVVPFKGFSNYACPFAFLADRLESAYPIFRAFYCRHLCRLHTISDHPGTLLSLCDHFERLTTLTSPRTAKHLFALDTSPLRYAFPWIVTGFVGSLPAEQVLQLWDRVLGFDSLELVSTLAAAIFSFRAQLVLAARRPEEVQLVFSDISCVKAIPLLQGFLFQSDLGLEPKRT